MSGFLMAFLEAQCSYVLRKNVREEVPRALINIGTTENLKLTLESQYDQHKKCSVC